MNKKLFNYIKNLPDYAQSYVLSDQDLQKDIIENQMTEEEIIWEVDFQLAEMKKKKKPITIRLNEFDIFQLKQKAQAKGIPYQTLINSIIRGFNTQT